MTNYEKIKKLLETNTCYVLVEYVGRMKMRSKKIISSIMINGKIRISYDRSKTEDCYDSLGATYCDEEDIDKLNLISITAIPISHEKIKGNVDIIDCEEIRELAKEEGWGYEAMSLLGMKNLPFSSFNDNENGQNYEIYDSCLPARFVIPTDCQTVEKKNEMTDEELDAKISNKLLLSLLDGRGLLEDKKVIK